MKFRAGDLEFNATVAESSQAPSPQTGDPLRSMTIQFRAQKAAVHEQALEAAAQRQAGGLFSLSDADEPEFEWRVRDSNTSYVGTEPWGVNHHVWRIEQVERLACERLIVGPVELEPYDYVEEASEEGAVRLAARAVIGETELDALSALSGAIEVIRVGISSTPRRMVLSGYVWAGEPYDLRVALVCEDVREPRVTRAGFAPSADADDLAELVAVLRARGALDEGAVDELRRVRHAKRRLPNVDTWTL